MFVDKGVAFLDDLEYIVRAGAPPRKDGRGLTSLKGKISKTAKQQDLAQLELFRGDVLRI